MASTSSNSEIVDKQRLLVSRSRQVTERASLGGTSFVQPRLPGSGKALRGNHRRTNPTCASNEHVPLSYNGFEEQSLKIGIFDVCCYGATVSHGIGSRTVPAVGDVAFLS